MSSHHISDAVRSGPSLADAAARVPLPPSTPSTTAVSSSTHAPSPASASASPSVRRGLSQAEADEEALMLQIHHCQEIATLLEAAVRSPLPKGSLKTLVASLVTCCTAIKKIVNPNPKIPSILGLTERISRLTRREKPAIAKDDENTGYVPQVVATEDVPLSLTEYRFVVCPPQSAPAPASGDEMQLEVTFTPDEGVDAPMVDALGYPDTFTFVGGGVQNSITRVLKPTDPATLWNNIDISSMAEEAEASEEPATDAAPAATSTLSVSPAVDPHAMHLLDLSLDSSIIEERASQAARTDPPSSSSATPTVTDSTANGRPDELVPTGSRPFNHHLPVRPSGSRNLMREGGFYHKSHPENGWMEEWGPKPDLTADLSAEDVLPPEDVEESIREETRLARIQHFLQRRIGGRAASPLAADSLTSSTSVHAPPAVASSAQAASGTVSTPAIISSTSATVLVPPTSALDPSAPVALPAVPDPNQARPLRASFVPRPSPLGAAPITASSPEPVDIAAPSDVSQPQSQSATDEAPVKGIRPFNHHLPLRAAGDRSLQREPAFYHKSHPEIMWDEEHWGPKPQPEEDVTVEDTLPEWHPAIKLRELKEAARRLAEAEEQGVAPDSAQVAAGTIDEPIIIDESDAIEESATAPTTENASLPSPTSSSVSLNTDGSQSSSSSTLESALPSLSSSQATTAEERSQNQVEDKGEGSASGPATAMSEGATAAETSTGMTADVSVEIDELDSSSAEGLNPPSPSTSVEDKKKEKKMRKALQQVKEAKRSTRLARLAEAHAAANTSGASSSSASGHDDSNTGKGKKRSHDTDDNAPSRNLRKRVRRPSPPPPTPGSLSRRKRSRSSEDDDDDSDSSSSAKKAKRTN